MTSMTVGIAGISGKFALLLALSLLERDPNIHIRGLARNLDRVDDSITTRSNVEIIQGSAFETGKIRSFARGCDVVVCCYLGDDHLMTEGQKVLIDIAEEEGVPRYLASDWSGDWTKLKMGELFSKEPCQRTKAYLDSKSRIKGVHILVGGFTEVMFAPFFSIWDAESLTFKYWGTGHEPWECTTYRSSAQYTAEVCLDQGATGVLRFAGDIVSVKDIAQRFSKTYGKDSKLQCLGSLDELQTKMVEERRKYGSDFYKYVFYWYHYFTLSGKFLMGPRYDNRKYAQVEPVTVEEFMKSTNLEDLSTALFSWGAKTQQV